MKLQGHGVWKLRALGPNSTPDPAAEMPLALPRILAMQTSEASEVFFRSDGHSQDRMKSLLEDDYGRN